MPKKKSSPVPILLTILLAIFIGNWTGQTKEIFGITFYSLFDLGGKMFINVLTLIIIPFVSSSIITGIARISNEGVLGRLGLKIFGFYFTTTFIAIIIGLFFVTLIQPGSAISLQNSPLQDLTPQAEIAKRINDNASINVSDIILLLFPSNIIDIFHGQMLGLISFSLVFGYAISKIGGQPGSVLLSFWQGIFQAMLKITELIMVFLPFGVFCLVAKSFATTGLDSLQSLTLFVVTVLAGLFVFMFIAMPILLKVVAKVNPLRHYRAMSPALITAFSTSSSSATLPITIDCVEKRAGVSNRICSLVVPLGTSINLSGSALYECVAALFIAQVYGVDISIKTQFFVVFLSLIMSIGVAGIPSASIVGILVILKAMNLPLEGIGLLIAVDRFLDMCRTTVNVFSDSCCAILVARSEGEKDVLTKKQEVLL